MGQASSQPALDMISNNPAIVLACPILRRRVIA
jgi:hypothetical protein